MQLPPTSELLSIFEPAEEAWPINTVLYQPYEEEQILLSDMADCLSVRAFLKITELPFEVEFKSNAEFMSPTGKVPFIKSGEFIIADLESIISFTESKGVSLSKELGDKAKADMVCYMSLIKTVLGKAELYKVWYDSSTVPLSLKRYGSVYPFPLNYILSYYKKSCCRSKLKAFGWLDKSLDEVYAEVDRCCKALSQRLDTSEYFFSRPTELDALLFGHIFTILTTELPENGLASIVRSYSNLVDHCVRIDQLYFKSGKNVTG